MLRFIGLPRNTRKISRRGHAISSFGAPIKLSKLATLCAPMSSVTTQRCVAFSNTRQCILLVLFLSSEMLRLARFLRNRPRTKCGQAARSQVWVELPNMNGQLFRKLTRASIRRWKRCERGTAASMITMMCLSGIWSLASLSRVCTTSSLK